VEVYNCVLNSESERTLQGEVVMLRLPEPLILEKSEVWRGGLTSSYISKEDRPLVSVRSGRATNKSKLDVLKFKFFLASKGGGTTSISLCINPEEFEYVAKAMFKADQKAAFSAFSKIAQEIAAQADDQTTNLAVKPPDS
jgi:hypothetical protein